MKSLGLGHFLKLTKYAMTQFLLQLCDEFIESALETSCRLAKHRKSNKLEIKDMQFLLGKPDGLGSHLAHIAETKRRAQPTTMTYNFPVTRLMRFVSSRTRPT